MSRRSESGRSQALWTEAEALERAGDATAALQRYVQAALGEERAGEPLRARLLWERLAARGEVGGPLLERLAVCSERAQLWDDAVDYWRAAAVRYRQQQRPADGDRAAQQAEQVAPRAEPHAPNALAAPFLA